MPDATQEYIERDAMLFEVGEYADRDLSVTDADIERLTSVPVPVPIIVGHSEQKITLGEMSGLRKQGGQLWGTLKLFKCADALLDISGVRSLSICVSRALDKIFEVSVTATPRVAGARMFSDGMVMFAVGETPLQKGLSDMPEDTKPPVAGVSVEEFANFKASNDALMAKMNATLSQRDAELQAARATVAELSNTMLTNDATAKVEAFVAAGKVPPALKAEAIAHMTASGAFYKSAGFLVELRSI